MATPEEIRQQKITIYNTVNELYERVQQFCEGVYFEIVVEPREPIISNGRRFIVNLVDFADDEIGHADILEVDPELKDRLRKIERLQDNYKLLMETAHNMFEQLKEEYRDRNCRIYVYRRQEDIPPSPRLRVDDEHYDPEDFEPQNNEEEFEEDDNWDAYSVDSGLDSETDVDPESVYGSDDNWQLSADSGLQSDTDTQSEMELASDDEPEWFW